MSGLCKIGITYSLDLEIERGVERYLTFYALTFEVSIFGVIEKSLDIAPLGYSVSVTTQQNILTVNLTYSIN